jgi:hypothetical protein
MKIIKNGNFTPIIRSLLIILGVSIVALPIIFKEYVFWSGEIKVLIFWIGIIVAAFGGYTAQADTYRLRPFGDLTWPKDKPGEKSKEESSTEKLLDKFLTMILALPLIGIVLYGSLDSKIWENGALVKLSAAVVVSLVIYFGIRKSRSK